jgi:hypothetical protein
VNMDEDALAVLVARDQELDALRREVQRWRRRAGEAEGVVTRMRELLQEAAQLCTSCDRWHKDECGHTFESRLSDADDHHARLRAPYASHLTLEAGQA